MRQIPYTDLSDQSRAQTLHGDPYRKKLFTHPFGTSLYYSLRFLCTDKFFPQTHLLMKIEAVDPTLWGFLWNQCAVHHTTTPFQPSDTILLWVPEKIAPSLGKKG